MRFWVLFKRNFKESYRDPLSLAFLLGFPLVFMLLFGLAFGETNPSFEVGIIDNDMTQVSETYTSDEVLGEILEISFYDDAESAMEDLKVGDLIAYLIIPDGFGQQISTSWAGEEIDIQLDITYDESDFTINEQVISIIEATTRTFAQIEAPITLNARPINIESDITFIDFIAPGIIIFGLLILVPNSARSIVVDKEKGFLSRLKTTPLRPSEFILGYSLTFVLIAVAQIIIFMLFSYIFGMDIVGNIILAFFIFLLTSLCCIGLGMIIASLSKSETQADPLSWLISMPMAMLSGCWFSLEYFPPYLRSIAYAFPFAHSIEAARGVLTRGVGLSGISTDFYWLIGWTMALFTIGIILFRKKMII
jgi:ABC-2 type transport system permease protein